MNFESAKPYQKRLGWSFRSFSRSSEFLSNRVSTTSIFQVVVTVAELAQLYETSTLDRSSVCARIDKSALEPVIRYHDHLWLIGQENDHCLSAYSSPRIKRTASTRDSAAARRKAATKLSSQISTTSNGGGGERDTSLDQDDDDPR